MEADRDVVDDECMQLCHDLCDVARRRLAVSIAG